MDLVRFCVYPYGLSEHVARALEHTLILLVLCLGLIDALIRVDLDPCFSYLIRSRNRINFSAAHF